jgi:hypothetical protein
MQNEQTHDENAEPAEALAPAPPDETTAGPKRKEGGLRRLKGRFKIVLSVLIALTSLLGAVAAWQAEAASSKRDADNGSGFAKSVAKDQTQATLRARVASQLLDYEQGKDDLAQANALNLQARHGAKADRRYLRTQSAFEADLGKRILATLDPDAFGANHAFNPEREFAIDFTAAKNNSDFDSNAEFVEAGHQATKASRLVGLTVLLIGAAFFFTLAQVSSRRGNARLYAGGGLLVLVTAGILLLLVVVAT